jgi:hypothetical protein
MREERSMNTLDTLWLERPGTGVVWHLEAGTDLVARLRREGYVEVPDPTAAPAIDSDGGADAAPGDGTAGGTVAAARDEVSNAGTADDGGPDQPAAAADRRSRRR